MKKETKSTTKLMQKSIKLTYMFKVKKRAGWAKGLLQSPRSAALLI